MQVDDALLDKLSRLSALSFDENERAALKDDLQKMIGFVDKLRELDTTGVEPLLHMAPAANVLREDRPGGMLSQEEALKNAPLHRAGFVLVPKVIKKDEA